MDLKRLWPILPAFVAFASFAGIVALVLLYIGFPMAGVASALVATGLAVSMTLAMAYFFSHAETSSGHHH